MSDTELKNKLLTLQTPGLTYVINSLGVNTPDVMHALVDFIQQYTAQAVKEAEVAARIDTLELIRTDNNVLHSQYDLHNKIQDRIAALKREQDQSQWGKHVDKGPGATHYKGDDCEQEGGAE